MDKDDFARHLVLADPARIKGRLISRKKRLSACVIVFALDLPSRSEVGPRFGSHNLYRFLVIFANKIIY